MNKKQAIEKLNKLHSELSLMERFNGRARLLTSILKKISHLKKYKSAGNLPNLFVDEAENDLKNIAN